MSVGTLLGTPAAAGLFHGAIAQSGAAHHNHLPEVAEWVTGGFLAALDLSPTSADALADPARRGHPAGPGHHRAAGPGRRPARRGAAGWCAHLPARGGRRRAPRAGRSRPCGPAAPPACPLVVGHHRRRVEPVPPAGPHRAGRLSEDQAAPPPGPPGRRRPGGRRARRLPPRPAPGRPRRTAVRRDDRPRVPHARHPPGRGPGRPHAPGVDVPVRLGSTAMGGALGACHAIEVPFVFDNLDRRGVDLLLGGLDDGSRGAGRRASPARGPPPPTPASPPTTTSTGPPTTSSGA